jgi:phosphatidylglycerophosphate synthase
MRTASPPLDLGGRGIRLPALTIRPEKILVAANALSLSRGIAALIILALSLAGVSPIVVLAVAGPMWLTDALDGQVARAGWRRGARRRLDGAALDPLMDDVAFVCGFLILLEAGVAPLWFVAGLLASRVLFALIRMVGLSFTEPFFARPLFVTKFNGAVLAIGQLLLLAHMALPATFFGSDWLVTVAIATMTTTTIYSVVQFAARKHGRLLVRLLAP